MKYFSPLLLLILFVSCLLESENVLVLSEYIFVDYPDRTIKIDILCAPTSDNSNKRTYNFDKDSFIENLNGCYFHRNNIGLIEGKFRTIINDELYDLKDDKGGEASIFLMESKKRIKMID